MLRHEEGYHLYPRDQRPKVRDPKKYVLAAYKNGQKRWIGERRPFTDDISDALSWTVGRIGAAKASQNAQRFVNKNSYYYRTNGWNVAVEPVYE